MVAREAAEDEVLRRDLAQQVESLTQRLQATTVAVAEKVPTDLSCLGVESIASPN